MFQQQYDKNRLPEASTANIRLDQSIINRSIISAIVPRDAAMGSLKDTKKSYGGVPSSR